MIRLAHQMTSAELAAHRTLPLHVQTMARASNVDKGRLVYSDVEEFSAEALALNLSRPEWRGWQRSGPPFIRQRSSV